MKILPSAIMKPLSTCQSGELVRPTSANGRSLAFVATNEQENGRFLVNILAEPLQHQVHYEPIRHDEAVLSYGHDYDIQIDHLAAMELRPRQLFEQLGCVHLVGAALQLRCGGHPQLTRGWPQHYVLASGQLVPPPDINVPAAVFTGWSVSIDAGGEKALQLYRFLLPT